MVNSISSDKVNQPNGSIDNTEQTSDSVTNSSKICKRDDYITWWDYFLSISYIASLRSKDPNTQVGACIVNEENRIVGIGYNGFPNKCSDDELPWARSNPDPLENKYLFVCHAEMNAILNKNSYDCKNCTIFVILFPCNECAKLIIQSGIKRVVYVNDKYKNDVKYMASRKLLEMAGVELIHYVPKKRQILIDFDQYLE